MHKSVHEKKGNHVKINALSVKPLKILESCYLQIIHQYKMWTTCTEPRVPRAETLT